jgi:hypothetical protein
MLVRLILLAILVVLLVRFLVRLGGVIALALREGAASPKASSAQPQAPAVALVPCRRCGVFVPQSLAANGVDGFLCRSCAAA